MANVIAKHDFRAPSDNLPQEIKRLKLPEAYVPATVSAAPLAGTWVNVDHHTRGLVRLVIAQSGNEITLHGFGACSPSPCDWGIVPGTVYAEGVTGTSALAFAGMYTFGFKQTTIVGRLMNGALAVATFDHFMDNSGRSDYFSEYILGQ
ncbi:hypothetical protein DYQ86_21270 [Acidobacteria bacterium AB60]|nr:hypothetical protein DYQ86_21270 [Acidobacteria bacterium AB60]